MKALVLVGVLGLSMSGIAQESGTAKHLEELCRQFGVAWLKGDVRTLDGLLAREYTHTDVTGKVLHRADWLQDAANVQRWARPVTAKGEPSIDFDDLRVTVLGDSAVLTGGNTIRSADPAQPPMRLRFTQVWVKQDGGWKRQFFQATPILSSGR